jgi:D-alanyl-lipoteichoic acid acyltransferase DltB (MBOAT superfamily)
MNFTEFSFWWILVVIGAPFLIFRCFFKRLGLWGDVYDRLALSALSLLLFWNAASSSFVIFVSELAFNYFAIRLLQHIDRGKSIIVACVIVIDLLVLIHFKYIDFIVSNSFGLISPNYTEVLRDNFDFFKRGSIPPGISFYTFQMIAFLVDTAKAKDRTSIRLLNYLNFASFFPQIVAGPIERRSNLFPQMQAFNLRFSYENIENGLRWLVLGMFMKLVLADNISQFIIRNEVTNAYLVWLSIYLFGLKIYFDFAGYSFIALGIARILGINLTINFRAPYMSSNIQEFWRRWHVSLMSWLRDYLYIPLGGGRVKWVYLNIFAVFLICGLWHGAGWNFVLWGGYHGFLLVVYRYLSKNDFISSLRTNSLHITARNMFGWATTYVLVMFGWLFFMETDFSLLIKKLEIIGRPSSYAVAYVQGVVVQFSLVEFATLCTTLFFAHVVLGLEFLSVRKGHRFGYHWVLLPWVSRIMLAMIILMSARSPSPFIYFEF